MDAVTFGKNVKRCREEAGLSPAKLASQASLSRNTIRNIELARHSPTLTAVFRIAEVLGKHPASLLTDLAA